MNTILLTCSGGPAAVGVIKSIRGIPYKCRIVSIDLDPLAVGGLLSDVSYTVPNSESDEYWDVVFDIIKKEKVTLILPTGDSDIKHFSKHKSELESMGISVFMSDYDTILNCQNKMRFYEFCVSKFSDVLPKTSLNGYDLNLPVIAKPKVGSGSRGIHLCKSNRDLESITGDYIFQSYLPGKEYTVDLLSDLDCNVLSCVVRERLQVKAGISVKGKVIINKTIEKMCTDLAQHLNIKGPVCIQLKEDENGNPKFIEVNPRLGGGTYFSRLAGVNFVEIILQIVNGKEVHINSPKEITVVRYFNEIVV